MLPRAPGAREVVISNSLQAAADGESPGAWGLGGQIPQSPSWPDPLPVGAPKALLSHYAPG